MDKLGTEWRPLSISTTFRVKFAHEQPLVSTSGRGERFYTEPCGLGWRFAMLYSSFSQSIMLEYDAHYAHKGLGHMQVMVTLRSEEMQEGECFMREMRPADPEKRTPIVSWPASAFLMHRILVFKVSLRDPIDVPPPSGLAPSIRHALGESTRTGTFVDTRFFVYSRKAPSGRVFHPLPVYANGSLLAEKSDYMNTLLNISGFSESTTGDIKTGFPSDGEPFTDGYDYTSDSDLDSDEDSDAVLAADRNLLRRNTAPTQEAKLIVRPAAERVPSTYSMSSAYSGYSSMSAGSTASSTTLGPDHSSSSNPFPGMGATSGGSTSASTPSTQSKVNDTIPIPIERSGRTIHVKDMAYRTWQSLIFYLYTGDIAFLPLKSDTTQDRTEFTAQHLADRPHDPPPCSPKSMYRLAEKLGLEELERLSFQAIRAGLGAHNILPEVFSRFSAKYSALAEMEVDLLVREHYDAPGVSAAFAALMGPVAEGEMPHSAAVLTSIFERLASRRAGGV